MKCNTIKIVRASHVVTLEEGWFGKRKVASTALVNLKIYIYYNEVTFSCLT